MVFNLSSETEEVELPDVDEEAESESASLDDLELKAELEIVVEVVILVVPEPGSLPHKFLNIVMANIDLLSSFKKMLKQTKSSLLSELYK